MRRKTKRLVLVSGALGVAGVAAGLTLFALRDSVVFFYGPTEFAQKSPALGTRLRIGGLVERGSLAHVGDATVHFAVTDNARDVRVSYTGILPDLFREGQGVVAEGTVTGRRSRPCRRRTARLRCRSRWNAAGWRSTRSRRATGRCWPWRRRATLPGHRRRCALRAGAG